MTTDDIRAHLRPLLERDYGVEGAGSLLDRPPGGWSDLVTNRTLEREIDALRHELHADMAELRAEMAELQAGVRDELRAQTKWLATLVIAAQGVLVAVIGGIGALLRFA